MSKKILIAMSGGVDSTIAAWKLKNAGYDVTGIHFRFWKWRGTDADHEKEIDRLQRLAGQIGIDLNEVDAQIAFRDRVIGEMFSLLGKGLTPNPCIHCNPMMKFDLLLAYAEKEQAELVSTGHYVISKTRPDGSLSLFKARDKSKDQSYFLCRLTQDVLQKCVFPLGESTKQENIETASDLGLSFMDKPESQDLCFLTNESYSEFINEELPEIMVPGEIRNTTGKMIGTHHGLPNYTIGQRKGIEIAAERPYYVIFKDIVNNALIVGPAEELKFRRMTVSDVNWISDRDFDHLSCNVKIRYRSPDYACELTRIDLFDYLVEFTQDIRDITAGQYAVFYHDEEMLGGGMIRSVDNNNA